MIKKSTFKFFLSLIHIVALIIIATSACNSKPINSEADQLLSINKIYLPELPNIDKIFFNGEMAIIYSVSAVNESSSASTISILKVKGNKLISTKQIQIDGISINKHTAVLKDGSLLLSGQKLSIVHFQGETISSTIKGENAVIKLSADGKLEFYKEIIADKVQLLCADSNEFLVNVIGSMQNKITTYSAINGDSITTMPIIENIVACKDGLTDETNTVAIAATKDNSGNLHLLLGLTIMRKDIMGGASTCSQININGANLDYDRYIVKKPYSASVVYYLFKIVKDGKFYQEYSFSANTDIWPDVELVAKDEETIIYIPTLRNFEDEQNNISWNDTSGGWGKPMPFTLSGLIKIKKNKTPFAYLFAGATELKLNKSGIDKLSACCSNKLSPGKITMPDKLYPCLLNSDFKINDSSYKLFIGAERGTSNVDFVYAGQKLLVLSYAFVNGQAYNDLTLKKLRYLNNQIKIPNISAINSNDNNTKIFFLGLIKTQ